MTEPLAIVCSDIHLCHTPPAARAAEPNWYAAMGRALDQLREIQEDVRVPILCGGDLFDRWNSGPELINWAMRKLPEMYAIPGQHDLPYHRIEDIRKSAYWTLVEARTIKDMGQAPNMIRATKLFVHPFPWGSNLNSLTFENGKRSDEIDVALAHRCVWGTESPYPGAPADGQAAAVAKQLKGFDVAVFGDNHYGFTAGSDPTIYNCGCLIQRKQNERDYQPAVGIIMSDGTVERRYLDTSQDK